MGLQIKKAHREQRQRTNQVSQSLVDRAENLRPVAISRTRHSDRENTEGKLCRAKLTSAEQLAPEPMTAERRQGDVDDDAAKDLTEKKPPADAVENL